MDTLDARLAAAGHNTKISRTFPFYEDKVGMTCTITTELIEKKRGAKPLNVIATYCPWCGAKYRGEALDPADPWRGLYDPAKMPKLDGVDMCVVAHPDLPEWPNEEDEERGIDPLIRAQGFAWDVVSGEYPDDNNDDFDCLAWLAAWEPRTPAGNGWRLAMIHDTEDGPAALYVRPLGWVDEDQEQPNG